MFYAIKASIPNPITVATYGPLVREETHFAASYDEAKEITDRIKKSGGTYRAFAWDAAEQLPEHFEP